MTEKHCILVWTVFSTRTAERSFGSQAYTRFRPALVPSACALGSSAGQERSSGWRHVSRKSQLPRRSISTIATAPIPATAARDRIATSGGTRCWTGGLSYLSCERRRTKPSRRLRPRLSRSTTGRPPTPFVPSRAHIGTARGECDHEPEESRAGPPPCLPPLHGVRSQAANDRKPGGLAGSPLRGPQRSTLTHRRASC